MNNDKRLEGAVVFVDSDSFTTATPTDPERKKLEDAGAIVVFVKPGSRQMVCWPPPDKLKEMVGWLPGKAS